MDTIQIDFKTLKKGDWSKRERRNAELVVEFVQQLMNDHDFDTVRKKFTNPHYRQHNRSIPDGMEGLIQYIENFTKQFPEYAYDVKRIHADGDYVIFHSHITTKKKHRGNEKKGINASDTWRIESGQIVEHWDSLQAMNGFLRFWFWISGGKIANTNGVY
ncbi:MAG: nuclear transport factor 2 family protein [Spirochaetota bacterium]